MYRRAKRAIASCSVLPERDLAPPVTVAQMLNASVTDPRAKAIIQRATGK